MSLLRKIKQWIRSEPLRFDMEEWVKTGRMIPSEVRPPCKTAACIAGCAIVLTKPNWRKIIKDNADKIPEMAAEILGLTYQRSEDEYSAWSDGSGEAVKLFSVELWPDKFQSAYNDLYEELQDDPDKPKTIKRKMAKIACDRIDYFIKHRK